MQPKLQFRPNVKACAKSSHYENVAHPLTYGWFGDVFFVLIAQKLVILADPISTSYNVGIVGLTK